MENTATESKCEWDSEYVKSKLVQETSDGEIYIDTNDIVYYVDKDKNNIEIIGYLNSEGQVISVDEFE